MRPHSTLSDSDSDSTMSSAFSDNDDGHSLNNSSSSQQFFAKLVQNTRSKVEQKTSVINATMQEKLPEWKQRGAMYSTKAKETSMEWSRRGKVAVDRWKKDRADEDTPYPTYRQPSQGSENAVFGMPLEVAVALTKLDADDLIPAVFRRCIEYLNSVGVHEVGIYRIPGSTITVNKLRAIFNDGSDVDFDVTRPDPHAVGTLLKMYLRELPEPIIPFELTNEYTQQFMKSIQTSDEIDKKAMEETIDVSTSLSPNIDASQLPPISPDLLKTVRSITSKLPIYNFCLLQLLCRHLKRVADNEEENRMSISNLAVIFIPTLNMGRALFHCMVEHYFEIFEGRNRPAGPVSNSSSSTSSKATTIVPPPLPQKPRNLTMDHHGTKPKKIVHAKTMSDTHLIMNNNPVTTSPVSLSPKVPPPKPNRSPLPNHQRQQSESQPYTGTSNPLLPRPRVPLKPRSKSLSSPVYKLNHHSEDDDILQKTSGRVEAIGRQFETLMNNKK
ncbi:Rho GTPase activation protein [Helicostylum pulchrum]|nr:Rho GTPase activation protein [Helicostylum pulchrum]